MRSTTLQNFEQHVAEEIDQVVGQGEPLLISRPDGKNVVVLAESDYDALRATLREFASPQNIERLDRAIAKLESSSEDPS
ncbi:MAG: type II toxin-antitoxin system Phd/YefM family antitoxin [Bacteroidota bacterium]